MNKTDRNEKTCATKTGQYRRICQAIKHADSLMDRVALMFDPVRIYRCYEHSDVFYHVGHDRFMNLESQRLYQEAARSRGRSRRLNGGDTDIRYMRAVADRRRIRMGAWADDDESMWEEESDPGTYSREPEQNVDL